MIKLNEETHTYVDTEAPERRFTSVTELLSIMGISPDYSTVNPDLLKASAERGKLIHKAISDFILTGKASFTKEGLEVANYLSKNYPDQPIISEQSLSFKNIAGTLDIFIPKSLKVIDIKTTSTIHTDSVAWQLSLYALLLSAGQKEDYEKITGEVFWFDADANLVVKAVGLKKYEHVIGLIDAYNQGLTHYDLPLDDETKSEIDEIAIIQHSIAELDDRKKEFERRLDAIKDGLVALMEQSNILKLENEEMTITYCAPTTRKTIDTARLKKERPVVAEEYSKETPVKASIRITSKKK
jgi:regulator of replication initiation timing